MGVCKCNKYAWVCPSLRDTSKASKIKSYFISDFERFERTFPSLLSCSKNRFGQAPQLVYHYREWGDIGYSEVLRQVC